VEVKVRHVIGILVVMTLIHVIATLLGHYESDFIWIDKILHIMAGVAIGMFWLWIIQHKFKKIKKDKYSKFLLVTSVIGFVLIVAFAWEIAEYAFWKNLPTYAQTLKLYSPSILDLVTDILANIVGGVIVTLKI